MLLLVTLGGDADATYRLTRLLQNRYQEIHLFIPGLCKSAGTLVAVGAHRLIIGDRGELGPLDVQFYKSDELDETSSGLIVEAAVKSLRTTAIEMLEEYFLRLKTGSSGLITLKTATEIASDLVAKILEPISAQIDPFRIGENDLAMRVARDYGERLADRSRNTRDRQSLGRLVNAYPSHDFVIDREEAATLFSHVEKPDAAFEVLAHQLELEGEGPGDDAEVRFLNEPAPVALPQGQAGALDLKPADEAAGANAPYAADQPSRLRQV